MATEDLAIVGVAGRFPGAADPEAFFERLCRADELISFFEEPEPVRGLDRAVQRDSRYVKAAGLLPGIELFDASFFGIAEAEAELMDPQHRLLLECAWEALERAGYDRASYDGAVGVYVGTGLNKYLVNNLGGRPDVMANADALFALTGSDKDFVSSRISYKLGLRGPSVTVQSACSTSLVAVHLACQALLAGECDMALAGAAAIQVPQRVGHLYIEGGLASPDGHTRVFDARAQGTTRSSAAGIVVIKRREDARRDRDHVLALIKGSAVNNDGAERVAFVAPSVDGQAAVVAEALAVAEVSPDSIGYVEAHGMATRFGDAVEVAALARALGTRSTPKHDCALGSVKTNLGSADAASGIVALIKTVFALKHGVIPPTLHFETPNPDIDFASTPFVVNTACIPWPTARPRRAGISSFGIGGTNAHIILEEAPPPEPRSPHPGAHVLVLSAKTPEALEEQRAALARFLERDREVDLRDVAFTLAHGRRHFAHRLALTCATAEEAVAKLRGRRGEHDALDPLAAKWAQRESVDPKALNPARDARRVVLPTYPFQRARYWIESAPEASIVHAGSLPLVGHAGNSTVSSAEEFRVLGEAWRRRPRGARPTATPGSWLMVGMRDERATKIADLLTAAGAAVTFVRGARDVAAAPAAERITVLSMAGDPVGPLPWAELARHVVDCKGGFDLVTIAEVDLPGSPRAGTGAAVAQLDAIRAAFPTLRCRHIDLAANTDDLSRAIADELLAGGDDSTVALTPRGRFVREQVRIDHAHSTTGGLRDGGVYLLNAWGGPVVARIADHLARTRKPRLVIADDGSGVRSERIAGLETSGAVVQCIRVDATDPGSWRAAIDLAHGLGELRGVFFGYANALFPTAFPSAMRREADRVEAHLSALDESVRGAALEFTQLVLCEPASAGEWLARGRAAAFAARRGWAISEWPRDATHDVDAGLEIVLDQGGGMVVAARRSSLARRARDQVEVDPILASVTRAWRDVLGGDPRPQDNYFELGGDSLRAASILARVRASSGVDVPLRAMLERPTIAACAEMIHEHLALARGGLSCSPAPTPLSRRDRSGAARASLPQERLWFLAQLEPESAAYNLVSAVRIRGRLDIPVLQRAMNEIFGRHDAFRTTFRLDGTTLVQIIATDREETLSVVDLTAVEGEARVRAAEAHIARAGARPFDLAQGPLSRIALLRLAESESVLVCTMHHIVSDGWSMSVLTREFSSLYAELSAGGTTSLSALMFQPSDHAEWQHRALQERTLREQLAYWKDQLDGAAPALDLPGNRGRASGGRAGYLPLRFSHELSSGLRALCRESNVTPFVALVSAFAALLGRYAAQEDVCIGTPVAGRTQTEIEPLIGFFVNTLVLRADLSGAPSFRVLLERMRDVVMDALANQDVPFDRVVESLHPERTLGRTPLFQVMFVLQDEPAAPVALPGLELSALEIEPAAPMFDLTLTVRDEQDGFVGSLEYDASRFDAAMIERMGGHFETFLQAAVDQPQEAIDSLPLEIGATHVPDVRRPDRRETADANVDVAVGATPDFVHDRFLAQASRTPDAIALVHERGTVTYAQLQREALRIARRLRVQGVGPEILVGVALERSPSQIAALYGVLAAGGAYVPLDPSLPPARLASIASDAGLSLVVTDAEYGAALGHLGTKLLILDGPSPAGEAVPLPPAHPASLAYVIYTSGSTGMPKGVGVTHASLAQFVSAAVHAYGLTDADRVLQFASFSFDASLEEIFPALSIGARLVLRTDDMTISRELIRRCDEWHVTVADLPTAMWHQLVHDCIAQGLSLPSSLRLTIVGGEKLSRDAVARFRGQVDPRARLMNSYGPTEATVVATVHEVSEGRHDGEVPIGRAIPGARVYVISRGNTLAPTGVVGELCIGGAMVARGYLGRPDTTAEAFVPDPFATSPGERMYRTGDRARWREDGSLEFLGRSDRQLKVRGFRVEPREIEAALEAHPSVREAAVELRQVGDDARLVAYVAPNVEGPTLRAWLEQRLPRALVPSLFVGVTQLPRTTSGKIDRHRLPAAEVAARSDYVAPRTATEAAVTAIWAEILRVPRVGVGDDFFALGGHSLLAARLAARIRVALGVDVPIRALFESPSVGGYCERIDALRSAGRRSASAIVPVDRAARRSARPVRLSEAPGSKQTGSNGVPGGQDGNAS
jgi:amino acid adenylation domain-containing protein